MAVKKTIPPITLRCARLLRRVAYRPARRIRGWQSYIRHKRLLARHRGTRPISVMFLISNTASWKVGPVFARMIQDPDFEPIAAICPITGGALLTEAKKAAELSRVYLDSQGFPYVNMVGLDVEQTRAEIRRIDPHLVFFTNPHNLVPTYLHQEILTSRLTCYVPYHHEVMAYGDHQEQYNQYSHNAFWRIFVSHEQSRQSYETTRIRRDAGVIVTGFPACEPLLAPVQAREPSPWKQQERKKKRVIYAPHWLLRPDIKMATIDTFGEAIMNLAQKYRDDVQWALRPHPMLKSSLMETLKWEPKRIEDFFSFWEQSDFCQIHEDDYLPLFLTSDAIVHDSGSFLAEYLYMKKPAMYLMTDQTGERYFNEFGRRAIAACDIGRSSEDIERFLNQLINSENDNENENAADRSFFTNEIAPHFQILPSIKICDEIRRAFS